MADVFKMLFNCFDSIFDVFDSASIITIAGVDVSLGDVLWGFFILSVIFTFFLVPRAGSGLGGVGNVLTFMRDDFNREVREERRKQNEQARASEYAKRQAERNSYEFYAQRRKRNTVYFNRYNRENGIKNKKGDK